MWLKILICTILSTLYLFKYDMLLLSIVSTIFFIILFFIEYHKYANSNFVLFELLIIALPFSYYPVIGDKYVSLFTLIQISFVANFFNKNHNRKQTNYTKLCLYVLIIVVTVMYLFFQSNYDTMQIEIFIKVVIFLIPLWIFQTLNFTKEQINYLLKLFICSAFVSGLMLIIQYIGFTLYNHDLGLYRDYTSRLAYAGLFFDFSIMSVYMSSIGSLFVVNILLRNVIFNKFIDIIFCLFFIALSVLTSARSGLFAFTSVVFLFLLFNRRFKTAIIMLLVAVPLSTFILNIFSINRQNENLLSDNGRFANFQEAYNFIIQHPFFGAGCLGYFNTTGNMDIHNFILDFLVEYGIPVTILFFVIFIMLLAKSSKTSITLFYLFLHYLIGGLFHASFINAHYIVIPIFLIAASDAVDKSNAHFKIHLWKKHIKSFL